MSVAWWRAASSSFGSCAACWISSLDFSKRASGGNQDKTSPSVSVDGGRTRVDFRRGGRGRGGRFLVEQSPATGRHGRCVPAPTTRREPMSTRRRRRSRGVWLTAHRRQRPMAGGRLFGFFCQCNIQVDGRTSSGPADASSSADCEACLADFGAGFGFSGKLPNKLLARSNALLLGGLSLESSLAAA